MRSVSGILCWALALVGTVSAVDFDRARELTRRTVNLVYRDRVQPHWLPGGRSFWYRVRTGAETEEFVFCDAVTGERRAARSLAELGLPEPEPLRTSNLDLRIRRSARTGGESALRFINQLDEEVDLFWIDSGGEQVRYAGLRAGSEREQHTFAGHVWLIQKKSGEPLAVVEAGEVVHSVVIDGAGTDPPAPDAPRRRRDSVSPDGRWSAFVRNGRLMLREGDQPAVRLNAADVDETASYQGEVYWAPDSSAFVAICAPDWEQRKVTLVASSPSDRVQPKVREIPYTKPGDDLPRPQIVLFRLDGEQPTGRVVDNELFPTPFTPSPEFSIRWAPDSREFHVNYNQRGHQLYRILAVDAATAAVRVVVEETSPTFIDYVRKTWRHWLDETGELLWMSERDGWCHLWLYDVATGTVKNQVTSGDWVVRKVLHVDAPRREVWFYASGLRPEEDPYHQHLCRMGFDGSGFQQLTAGDGEHQVEFSPDREFFIDKWSRVDHPPVHELRRSDDGRLVALLETADASALLAAGWTMPERFFARGRDGMTDIHGLLIRPSHFDPTRKYPVLEEIYAGPHSSHVPKTFGRLPLQHELAELGLIVVIIDGMGTNHRSKAFHDVCWKNLHDAGFPDRIAWIKAAAADRPWMDLSRVGIYGGSAGGQNALRALLDHHDFYHVAVADCGCHDNRMDKLWWNEQWMGWPVDDSYVRSSNVEDAHKLQGDLLLIVGELDENVDPSSTLQVVGALQRANKRFEFMPIIGAGHGAAGTRYGAQLRMEFLARRLLGATDSPAAR